MTDFNQEDSSIISKHSFIFNALIGEGGFGRVLSGMLIQDRTWYAIKEINKCSVTKHQTGLSMLFSELKALQIVNAEPKCNFIVAMQAAFHDKASCYIVLDLKGGGDLRYYLRKRLIFEESDVAFFVACIGSALEFIHSRNILHRDVKPENIILDSRGFPHLTDFGVAYVQPEGTKGILTCRLASGTKQYLAPEVYCKSNVHGEASDFWSLGVLAFELLFGQRPFEKHCPSLHITYLEESLKRTAARSATKKDAYQGSLSRTGSWTRSPQRGLDSGESSPHGSSSRCSTSNMTTASTQRTEAMPTKDALFGRKKKDIRVFPDFTGGSESVLPRAITKGGYSVFDEANKSLPLGDFVEGDSCRSQDTAAVKSTGAGAGAATKEGGLKVRGKCSTRNITLKEKTGTMEAVKEPQSKNSRSAVDHNEEDGVEYITTDHWTVHAHELPIHLQVLVPKESDWLGEISDSCVEILKGFFEVRPSHRVGGRMGPRLRSHPWFKNNGIVNWRALENKTFEPLFTPDKKFLLNTFWRPEALGNFQLSMLEENTVVLPVLEDDQQHLFRGFDHISDRVLAQMTPGPEKRPKDDGYYEAKDSGKSSINNQVNSLIDKTKNDKRKALPTTQRQKPSLLP